VFLRQFFWMCGEMGREMNNNLKEKGVKKKVDCVKDVMDVICVVE